MSASNIKLILDTPRVWDDAGERIFDFFTPAAMGHHIVFFTFAMMFVCFIVFFCMVGAYPLYVLQQDPTISACLSALNAPSPRKLFVDWMFPRVSSNSEIPSMLLCGVGHVLGIPLLRLVRPRQHSVHWSIFSWKASFSIVLL